MERQVGFSVEVRERRASAEDDTEGTEGWDDNT